MHQYLLDGKFNYKLYYLDSPLELVVKRSEKRNNGNDQRFLRNIELRIKQIEKYEIILSNKNYNKNIIRKTNLNLKESNEITQEILCTIKE